MELSVTLRYKMASLQKGYLIFGLYKNIGQWLKKYTKNIIVSVFIWIKKFFVEYLAAWSLFVNKNFFF